MTNRVRGLVWLFLAGACTPAAWGRASGSGLTGLTGAPGDGNCTRCHTGTVNSGSGSVTITPDSTTFTAGQQIRLRITQADSAGRRWGYTLSARRTASAGTGYGTLAAPDALSQVLTSGGIQYAVQTSAGTQSGTASSASWDLIWTAPADTSGGAVTLYVTGLACDNDGSDRGDRTYTASLTLQPASTDPGVTGTSKALPQFVYGGGWSTTLYFGNTSTTATRVALKFLAEDGTALNVPAAGGSSATLNLAGRGSASLEAPDTGSLVSGWVQATIPEGVTGYAVFRQAVAGRMTQEAVVPLSGTASGASSMLFDESGFVTAIALLNPGSGTASVTLAAYDEGGSSLGVATVSLAAGAKMAFTVRERAGLAGVLGKRGMLEIVSSGSAVSVLGIRFSDAAFTSIPAVER